MGFKQLSDTELRVMNLFWEQQKPLSSAELYALAGESGWSYHHIYKILRVLQENGFLFVHSAEMDENHHRVKRFAPCISKEDYTADFLRAQKLGAATFAKIAVALIDQDAVKESKEKKEAFIGELEKIVAQLKNREQEE